MGCVYSHPGQNRGGNKQRSQPSDQHYHRSSKKPPQQPFPSNGKSRTTSIQSEPKPSVQPPSKAAENSGFEEPQFRRGNFDRNSVLRKSQKRSRKNSCASLNNSKALSGGVANNESVISQDQSVTNIQVNNEVTIGSKPTALDKQRKISNTFSSSSPMVPTNNENPKLDSSSTFLNDKQSSMMYDAFEKATDKNSHNFSTFGKAPERKESTSTTTTTTVSAIVNEENRKYSAKLNESSQFVSSFLNESNNADMTKISQDTTKSHHQQHHRKESIEEIMDSRKLSAIEEMWKSSSNNHRRTSLVENEQRKISSASANVAALLGKLSTPEDIIRIDTKTTFQPSEASEPLDSSSSNIRRPSSNGFSPTDLVERTTRDKTSPPRKSSSSQETRSTSRSRRSPAKEDCNPSSSSTTTEDLAEEDCGRLI